LIVFSFFRVDEALRKSQKAVTIILPVDGTVFVFGALLSASAYYSIVILSLMCNGVHVLSQ